jgi:hypothetical protein
MTHHHDFTPADVDNMPGRLFIKVGGFFERNADDSMPYIRDDFEGLWVRSGGRTQTPITAYAPCSELGLADDCWQVYTMLPQAFIQAPDSGCTATHTAGCSPGGLAALAVKVLLTTTNLTTTNYYYYYY